MNTEAKDYFSQAYYDKWNADEQARIDADIERNRKADAYEVLPDATPGTKVKVEQLKHSFVFGAHIFNFNQLHSEEANERYKEMYGEGGLFNSATVPFYWKTLEPIEGKPRFDAAYEDSAEFWINCKEPWKEPHYRRPAVQPIVDFCKAKKIRMHGHVLAWGSRCWQFPDWLLEKMPEPYRTEAENGFHSSQGGEFYKKYSTKQIMEMMPEYVKDLNRALTKRIMEIALRYGKDFDSWDICNESCIDFAAGRIVPEEDVLLSWYGLLPGDMDYRAFKLAEAFFPHRAKLNINDYNLVPEYAQQTRRLLARGCKVDIMGLQMHLFDPNKSYEIADGGEVQTPKMVRDMMKNVHVEGIPTHLSEITITSPNNDAKGEALQAQITRNLYRLWFSFEQMMGITWWNNVDGLGAPGEPTISGILRKDMSKKAVYETMDELINHEWRTNLTAEADAAGAVSFRGFRGTYKLSYVNTDGVEVSKQIELR